MKNKQQNNKAYRTNKERPDLGVKKDVAQTPQRRDGYVSRIVPKTLSRTRSDIKSWHNSLRSADNVENPRRARLYNLYEDILLDAHLTAQIELRMQHTLSCPFILERDGEEAEEETTLLKSSRWPRDINAEILWTIQKGHTLIEFSTPKDGILEVVTIPRNNVIPEKGLLLLKEDDTAGIAYRELREFGTWILEFGNRHDYGLLNKAVPHVLFKRFAQACWSELCEIYGIPPRFIKTDTQSQEMLDRAEAMLRDMGSAAYFIIDNTEDFQFAKGADTNGDVYSNLIGLCNSELSLLETGAVIGQDTKNGNRSKEESSLKLLDKIVQSDKQIIESTWNGCVIPALERIGILKPGLTFKFQQEEDLEKLWVMTKDALPYLDVSIDWIKQKFGIEVTGKREQPAAQNLGWKRDPDFFD